MAFSCNTMFGVPGFTIQNCDGLRKRLYRDSRKYSQKISELDRAILQSSTDGAVLVGGLKPPTGGSKYPVLPAIHNRDSRRNSLGKLM